MANYRVTYEQGNSEYCSCHRDTWLCTEDFDTLEQLREYLIKFHVDNTKTDTVGDTPDRELIDVLEIKEILYESDLNVATEVNKRLAAIARDKQAKEEERKRQEEIKRKEADLKLLQELKGKYENTN